MNAIGDILTSWQELQLNVNRAQAKFNITGKWEDLKAYNDAVDARDNAPFQPSLFE
jgi:hypothetical protein